MTIYSRLSNYVGIGVSVFFGVWLILGHSNNWPYWVIYFLSIPIMLCIYLLSLFVRYSKDKSNEDSIIVKLLNIRTKSKE